MEVLYIDSRYRSSGSPSDFTWSLRHTLRGNDMTHLRCEQARIMNSTWTVEEDNRVIYFRGGPQGTTISYIILELGFYTAEQLAAHLTQALSVMQGSAQYIGTSNSSRSVR